VRTTRFSLVCVGLDCALSWIGEVSGVLGFCIIFCFPSGGALPSPVIICLFLSWLLGVCFLAVSVAFSVLVSRL
jgi:uncharacterized membrane protein